MGDLWIFAVPALAVLPFIAHWLQKRFPEEPDDEASEYACSRCGHDAGLRDSHCAAEDDVGGWVSADCICQNDFHWRVMS